MDPLKLIVAVDVFDFEFVFSSYHSPTLALLWLIMVPHHSASLYLRIISPSINLYYSIAFLLPPFLSLYVSECLKCLERKSTFRFIVKTILHRASVAHCYFLLFLVPLRAKNST